MLKIFIRYIKIIGLLMAFNGSSFADQNDIRLDQLFVELAKPDQPFSTQRMLEGEIWAIWGQAPKKNVQKLMKLGHLSMRLRMRKNALKYYTQATRLAPNYAEAWNKKATVLYLLKRYAHAVVAVKKTLELEPRHFGALSGLGLIYEAYGEEKGAKAAYTKALSYNPHMKHIKLKLDNLNRISDEADI